MTRLTTNARRDLAKPLIEVDESVGRAKRVGAKLLRFWIPVLFAVGLLNGFVLVLFLFAIR